MDQVPRTTPLRAEHANTVGLPVRPFLYTLDQIAVLLDVTLLHVKKHYIYYIGRSTGHKTLYLMEARNIASPGERPEWRVAEREFVLWMKRKGFKVYEATTVRF